MMKESGAPKGQGSTTNHGNNPQDRGSLGNAPPRVGGGLPPPQEASNPNDNSGQPSWWKRLDTWKFVGEIIIVIVTIRIACIYSGQLDQMIENNRISRESLQSVQRAFISVNPIPEIQTANTGSSQIILFNLWMENSGVTPTKKLAAQVNWLKSNKGLPLPPNFTFPDAKSIDGSQDSTVSVIGPRDRFPLSVGPIPREFIERLYKGEVRFFIYGWVRYNDVFAQTPRHVVRFSYELVAVPGVVRLQTGQEGQGLQTLVNGPRFNCSDEECDEQEHQ
jgi:hypothetical protein